MTSEGPIRVGDNIEIDTLGDLVVTTAVSAGGTAVKLVCDVKMLTRLLLAYREAIERIDGRDGV